MKRLQVVWTVCVIVLLIGSVATADPYEIIKERKGEIVQRDGNNVTDRYIERVMETQVRVDGLTEEIKEAPAREGKGFMDGVLWGALGTILVKALLL